MKQFNILPFLIAILPFTASQAYAARPILCDLDDGGMHIHASKTQVFMDEHVDDLAYGLSNARFRCHFIHKKGESREDSYLPGVISFFGGGPDVHIANSRIMINCPLVRKSKLVAGANFYGVRATADAGVGVDVGVFSNKRLGLCFVTGVDIGVGAGVSFLQMSIDGPIQY